MSSPLENAKKKLAQLKAEVARVERFINDFHEFASGTDTDRVEPLSLQNDEGKVSEKSVAPVDSVDKSRRGKGTRPDAIAKMLENVIRDVGRPMIRSELVEALERRDVELAAADKPRYIGTIIWRHKGIFKHIEGRGYWLRSEPDPELPRLSPYTGHLDLDDENPY